MIPHDWTPVSSSTISQVKYDASAQELHVRFNNGGTYVYHNVPAEEAESLVHASSPGSHFHQNIKDQYDFRRA